ncbi:hypothetical protein ACTI_30910 [Actinoplanes sp. OR16]|uniref:hypothetical protein n=1 Tax=Actinoplanes sp. OR16 TaxID=946334 RepID=UPI000F6BFA0A|nr:hypothetical protein [Actinoplanes sp. OR16]BBH66406.1 hypothetical protein ACTI_30910 [Actinoplanes sp. OR16]
MRFFSNEAKDNEETSAPEVPQQRAGSPWEHGPADSTEQQPPAPQPTAFGASTVGGAVAASAAAGDTRAADGRTDRVTDAASGVADDRIVTDDRTVAFDSGARTTDDRIHDDRIDDGRIDDGRIDEDRIHEGRIHDDRIDADRIHDHVDGRTGDHIDDRTVPIDQDKTVPIGERTDAGRHSDEDPVDLALEDKGTSDDPKPAFATSHTATDTDTGTGAGTGTDTGSGTGIGTDRETSKVGKADADSDATAHSEANAHSEADTDSDKSEKSDTLHDTEADRIDPDRSKVDELAAGQAADGAIEDKGTFDDPEVVDGTDTDQATPVAATGISGPAPFFPTAETQTLKERWRDVQLRFVDDPKGATGEAAQLVDEAVDKLTTALRDQRGSLAKGTEDTEALRVELRAYRDILDRLLGL